MPLTRADLTASAYGTGPAGGRAVGRAGGWAGGSARAGSEVIRDSTGSSVTGARPSTTARVSTLAFRSANRMKWKMTNRSANVRQFAAK